MLGDILKSLLRNPSRADRSRRAQPFFEAAMALQQAHDYESAYREFEKCLALDPDHAEAHFRLGALLVRDRGAYPEAAVHLERALALNPRIEDGWFELGLAYYFQHDYPKAAASFHAALEADPHSVMASLNLGASLKEGGQPEAALEHLRRAYEQAPAAEGTLRNLVTTLIETDRCEEALSVAAAGVERDPQSADAHVLHGLAHLKLHEPERALECYDQALRLGIASAELHDHRGLALAELGRLPEAIEYYERALALKPDETHAAFHRALARLLQGDYGRGWDDYELRQLDKDYGRRSDDFPRWDGAPLSGRSLLVRREQGLGDEIMFASCLPQLVAAAGSCLIECEPRLKSIFRRSFPAATVFASTPDGTVPAGPVDFAIPAGSLPRLLRRQISDFPRHDGYLKADPQRVARWRERLASLGPGLKVGVSWAGGVRKTRRGLRSLPLESWLPILRTPNIRFVSLQYTPDAGDMVATFQQRHDIHIEHWQEAIDDYEETAALVCALDRVISVCTAVIHLAGALGRPVWIMAPYSPEWRYGFSGDTMPWYPSAKVFRQPAFGAWEPVTESVATELQRLTSAV